MEREQIIRMAREAGFVNVRGGLKDNGELSDYWDCWPGQLEHFANLVAAAEREACAKLCINIEQSEPLSDRIGWEHGTVDCHAAIRARGEK
jgi:hypothetical protein